VERVRGHVKVDLAQGLWSDHVASGGMQNANAEEVEFGSAEHLAFEHVDAVDVTFDGSGVPVSGESSGHGGQVVFEIAGEGADGVFSTVMRGAVCRCHSKRAVRPR
jgi:hypothetical protein